MTSFSATYSPEDNKLRLYASQRLDKDDYLEIKNAGFRWAPKQELFVAPSWSPEREDTLLGFVDEIDDEDYSPEERAADRAERFSGYRDKRRGEAGDHADTFESGPSAFGHQNRERAERQAARHDRHRTHAVSQWSKAEYWQARTAGVIRHALHKSSASVRRGRILRLEADQRKLLSETAEAVKRWETWKQIAAEPDAAIATIAAKRYAGGTGSLGYHYQHPRIADKPTTSLWSLLTYEPDPITGHEAATLTLADQHEEGPSHVGGRRDRWAKHYELRLAYERAMLAEEGGSAGAADMEAGGFVGKYQIQRVHRSPVTKAVVSVDVFGPPSYGAQTNADGTPRIVIHNLNIQKFGEDIYRAPTDEERATFKAATEARKAEEKAAKGETIALINPTDEDAERLQAHWNARGKARYDKAKAEFRVFGEFEPSEVYRMTQAQYSARSKGSYASFETASIHVHGFWGSNRGYQETPDASPVAFKVRTAFGRGNSSATPYRVIVITDKPQKPLPLDWNALTETKKTRQQTLFV